MAQPTKPSLRARLKKPVYRIFSEDLMLALAVILVPPVILPFMFSFSHTMLVLFDVVNYFILAVFILEYFFKIYVAESRIAYAIDPWHILDLLIILLAGVDFIPSIDWGRGSPLLRLLRIVRVFVIAGRAVQRAPLHKKAEVVSGVSRLKCNMLHKNEVRKGVLKEQAATSMHEPTGTWLDFQEVGAIDLSHLSTTLNVPKYVLESYLLKDSLPRIDLFPDCTAVFISDARLMAVGEKAKDIKIAKNGLLILCAKNSIATICPTTSLLFDKVGEEAKVAEGALSPARILYLLLKWKMKDYEELIQTIEEQTVMMEELPVGQCGPAFLEETFYLKKEIKKVHNGLRHFNKMLNTLKEQKVPVPGMNEEYEHLFDILYDESSFLTENTENVHESLISLIELHINTVSFDMNRVMRVLAVITCLALIPSIIGGMLGQNLADQPYNLTIFEIFFVVLSMMSIGAYIFYKIGWLK